MVGTRGRHSLDRAANEEALRGTPGRVAEELARRLGHRGEEHQGSRHQQCSPNLVKRGQSRRSSTTRSGCRAEVEAGIEHGLRHGNPTADLKRVRVRAKELTLPSQDQFTALVAEIRRAPFGPGLAGADRVELLASGGLRQGEAAPVSWTDCDFKRREIVARGDAETGTKNGEVRHGPMIPDMVRLVDRQRINRPDEPADAPARRVNDCQEALTRACKQLRIAASRTTNSATTLPRAASRTGWIFPRSPTGSVTRTTDLGDESLRASPRRPRQRDGYRGHGLGPHSGSCGRRSC